MQASAKDLASSNGQKQLQASQRVHNRNSPTSQQQKPLSASAKFSSSNNAVGRTRSSSSAKLKRSSSSSTSSTAVAVNTVDELIQGFKDGINFSPAIDYFVQSKRLKVLFFNCFVLNGLLFLGSIFVLDYIAPRIFGSEQELGNGSFAFRLLYETLKNVPYNHVQVVKKISHTISLKGVMARSIVSCFLLSLFILA